MRRLSSAVLRAAAHTAAQARLLRTPAAGPPLLAQARALTVCHGFASAAGAAPPLSRSFAAGGQSSAPNGELLRVLQVQASLPSKPIYTAIPRRSLCAETGLSLRDLRVVDPSFRGVPAILVRRDAIVVALEHIKCVITKRTVLVFGWDAPAVKLFLPDLTRALSSSSEAAPQEEPFEFRALSAALESIAARLSLRGRALAPEVQSLVSALHSTDAARTPGLGRDIPLRLVSLNTELARLSSDVEDVSDALQALLESDEDISGLYLSDRRSEAEHAEAELLLEGFARSVEEVASETAALRDTLRFTESYVRTALDASRNSLLRLDTLLTMGTLSVATGAFILGAFGMNLNSGLENDARAFAAATGAAGMLSGVTFAALWASAWNTLRAM